MRIFRATRPLVRNLLVSVSVVAVTGIQSGTVAAHTVSIGYVFAGPGAVVFWYGSYHPTATFNEADTGLVGPSYNSIQAMNLITAIKPMGLIDGTNNFYSNTAGTALVGAPEAVAGNGGSFNPATQTVLNWQGTTFTGLRPGTYTFTYNPLAVPTVEWHPINSIIESNSFTLTAQDILGIAGYRFYGNNDNQRAVGGALDTSIAAGGYNQRIYDIAALPRGPMAAALSQLSGEVHTQSSRAAFQPGGTFLSSMMDPTAGGMRGGYFGASPYGAPYSGSPYGSSYGGAPSAGPGYYNPQSQGNYGAGQQYGGANYGGAGYGDPSGSNAPYGGNPNSPYGGNPNAPYGSGGDGNLPYGNSGYGNASYGRSGSANDRGRGLFQNNAFENRWNVWQTTYGGYNLARGDAAVGSHDTAIAQGGVMAGLDFRFGDGGVFGAAISGGVTSWSLSDNLGSGKSDVMQAGLYGSKRFGAAYVSAALSAGWHKMKTERTVTISGSDTLRGSFDASTLGGRAEVGYRLERDGYGITPHVAGQMMSFKSPGYSESVGAGAGDFALAVADRTTRQTRVEAGVWLDRTVPVDDAYLTLRSRLAWAHEKMDAPASTVSFVALPGSTFTVTGASPTANRVLVTTGAEMRFTNGFALSGKFDGEFAYGAQSYAGSVTLSYQW